MVGKKLILMVIVLLYTIPHPYFKKQSGSVDNTDLITAPILYVAQSNGDGRNDVIDLPSYVPIVSDRVKEYVTGWDYVDLNAQGSRSPQGPGNFSSDAIAFNLLSRYLGKDVYVVKKSFGGTSFMQTTNVKGDWNIDSNEVTDHYLPYVNRIQSAINYNNSIGKEFNPRCLIFNIFETDGLISDTETLRMDFRNFVNAIRTLVNKPNLPIIHYEMGLTYNAQWIIDLQREFRDLDSVNGGIDNYYLIPYGSKTTMDGVHFDAASSIEAGEELFELLIELGIY